MATPGEGRTPATDAKVCAAIIATLAVPAVFTLRSARIPQAAVPVAGNPSPLGYTRSLSLFAVPIAVLGGWFLRHPAYHLQRRAFGITLALLVPVGFLLDLLRASAFFTFPNRAATIGIAVPVVGGTVPVEEFAFYLLGFIAVLLTYIWCDEYWLGAYNVPDYRAEAQGIGRVVRLHLPSLAVGLVLIVAGVAYKRLVSGTPGTAPGYFIFLVAHAVVPSLLLLPTARPFVNWRALSLTAVLMMLVALLWEATLAAPYQWWGFRERAMLGLHVGAWCRLPAEEPFLWIVVSYTTAIIYEVVKVILASRRPWLEALFGTRA